MSKFLKRTATALVAVPSLYALISSDQYYWILALSAMVLLVVECHLEIVAPIIATHSRPDLAYPLPLVVVVGISAAAAATFGDTALLATVLTVSLIVLISWMLAKVTRDLIAVDIQVFVGLAVQLLAFSFATAGFSVLVLLRAEDGGWGALFFLFGCCWQADNGALFVGSALGRFTSPFLPTVSAKKTWAGAFGALVFSSGSAYLYATLSQEATRADAAHRVDDDQPGSIVAFLGSLVPALPFETPTTAALVGLLLGLAAIVGDALASLLKRIAKKKDSGKLFPGHGGIVDRMDSVILSAPLLWGLTHLSRSSLLLGSKI